MAPKRPAAWADPAALLAGLAVLLTALNLARIGHGSPPTPPTLSVSEWREYDVAGHVLGDQAAPVAMIVFSDYQCPACRALHTEVERLEASKRRQLRVRWRHYPLATHVHARSAALAAVCAGMQGAFVEMHSTLFRTALDSTTPPWTRLAATSGVSDTARFHECMGSESAAAALVRDDTDARRLGVRATPTILIQGDMYGGFPSDLRVLVHNAIKQAKRADGVAR